MCSGSQYARLATCQCELVESLSSMQNQFRQHSIAVNLFVDCNYDEANLDQLGLESCSVTAISLAL